MSLASLVQATPPGGGLHVYMSSEGTATVVAPGNERIRRVSAGGDRRNLIGTGRHLDVRLRCITGCQNRSRSHRPGHRIDGADGHRSRRAGHPIFRHGS